MPVVAFLLVALAGCDSGEVVYFEIEVPTFAETGGCAGAPSRTQFAVYVGQGPMQLDECFRGGCPADAESTDCLRNVETPPVLSVELIAPPGAKMSVLSLLLEKQVTLSGLVIPSTQLLNETPPMFAS